MRAKHASNEGAHAYWGSAPAPFDLVDTARHQDVYAVYRRYREADPVHWGLAPGAAAGEPGWWYVFSHEGAQQVLRDHVRFGSDPRNALPGPHDMGGSAFWSMYSKWMKVQDPPVHKLLRTRAAALFGRDGMTQQPASLGRLAENLLDRCGRAPFDLMREYAYPLALQGICQFMDLERADLDAVRDGLEALNEVFDPSRQADPAAAERATLALQACIASAVPDGAADPEHLAFHASMLFAGYEAPALAIGNCMVSLLRGPELFAAIKAGDLPYSAFIEEALRLHAPIQATSRFVLRDTEIGGRAMTRGQAVTVVLGAANRDPRAFAEPDAFVPGRAGRPLAFGDGIHYCVGVRLGVLMAEVALAAIVRRFDGLAHREPSVQWRGCGFRGPARLLVAGLPGGL